MATGFAACDNGSSPDNTATAGKSGGPVVPGGTAGSGNNPGGGGANPSGTAGTPGTGGGNTGGSGPAPEGVPITPTDGWVDAASNALGIVGALYSYADDTSGMGLMGTFVGETGCMKGTAAQVMDPCTVAPTASDCFGTFWGAAMGLNLNQPKDPATGMGVKDPLPFDASMLRGFTFEITGPTIPVAKSLRFKVENAKGEFCTPPSKKVLPGVNTFEFKDLIAECWHTTEPPNATAETAQSALLKISWAVVTDKMATVPFDFCVSNIRALLKPGVMLPPVGTAGASGVAGAPASGGAAAGGAPAGGATASGGAGGAKAGAGGTGG